MKSVTCWNAQHRKTIHRRQTAQTADGYEKTMGSIVYCPEKCCTDLYFAENYAHSYELMLSEKDSLIGYREMKTKRIIRILTILFCIAAAILLIVALHLFCLNHDDSPGWRLLKTQDDKGTVQPAAVPFLLLAPHIAGCLFECSENPADLFTAEG